MCQRARLPLAVLLGAQLRPVPVTMAGCYPTKDETPASITELMMAMAAFKASAIKITGSGDLERDSRRLVDCTRALGDGTPLIIDLYGSVSSADELLRYAKGWADLDMAWLEDPFRFDNLTELALLTSELPYPVGAGDEQSGLENFRNLVRFAGVRVVRLDATTCGGVTGFRRISSVATAARVPVSCHVFHHLHAQLACLAINITVEYILPDSGVDAIHELLGPDLEWRDRSLIPENSPGICSAWNVDSASSP
jgi:L-alanine-DL-glutamate epimerase-like enolase superfamily enzyme